MKKFLVLLFTVVMVLSFGACGNNETDQSIKDEATATATANVTTITTPYAELHAPENYTENVIYEVEKKDPYTLTFSTKKDGIKLYSLIFNGDGDILLGTILGDKENTTLHAKVYSLDAKDNTYSECAEYQEGMYTILTNLRKDYQFEDNAIVEKPETFEIKTDVVTLQYPKKWKDKVTVKNGKDAVTFSSDNTDLFIISFVDDGGYLLGEYQGHPVYITVCSLDSVKKDTKKHSEMSEMQEDSNILLEILESDPDFVSAHSSD